MLNNVKKAGIFLALLASGFAGKAQYKNPSLSAGESLKNGRTPILAVSSKDKTNKVVSISLYYLDNAQNMMVLTGAPGPDGVLDAVDVTQVNSVTKDTKTNYSTNEEYIKQAGSDVWQTTTFKSKAPQVQGQKVEMLNSLTHSDVTLDHAGGFNYNVESTTNQTSMHFYEAINAAKLSKADPLLKLFKSTPYKPGG